MSSKARFCRADFPESPPVLEHPALLHLKQLQILHSLPPASVKMFALNSLVYKFPCSQTKLLFFHLLYLYLLSLTRLAGLRPSGFSREFLFGPCQSPLEASLWLGGQSLKASPACSTLQVSPGISKDCHVGQSNSQLIDYLTVPDCAEIDSFSTFCLFLMSINFLIQITKGSFFPHF